MREIFSARKSAVEMLVKDERRDLITSKTGISGTEAIRFLLRVVSPHPDGGIWGYRALIPWLHVGTYVRTITDLCNSDLAIGFSGAFSQLLETYPDLRELIEDEVFKGAKPESRTGTHKRNSRLYESRIQIKSIHQKFLDLCREKGLNKPLQGPTNPKGLSNSGPRYPFNVKKRALESLTKFVHKLIETQPSRSIPARFGAEAAKKMQTGDGSGRPLQAPFTRIECDAHRIDAIFCILIPTIHGELVRKIVRRLWLIVLEEVSSRAALSQHLCLGEEPTGEDVLEAIRLALTLWEPRKLIAPNMKYSPSACFPSGFDPRFLGAKWEQFSVDGALANIAEMVRRPIKELLGIEPIVLPRRNKDDRPYIERFFQTFEELGFHRLPNTTGSGTDDPRRNNPEMAAIKYTIQMEYLEDIADVIIANYNGAPHSYHGQPPVEYLEFACASSGKWPQLIDPRDAEMLLCYRETVVVRGSIKDSRRPYIHWHGVNYSNDALKHSYALVGKKLTLLIHRRDLRTIRAFRDNGAELGVLRAATPWDRMPHTLEMRRAFFSLRRDRRFRYNTDPDHCDPIFALLEHLEATALKKKVVPPLYLEVRGLLTKHLEEFRDQVSSRPADDADNKAKPQNNSSEKRTHDEPLQQNAPLESVKALNW
jgi:hypothetical protein